LRVEGLAFCLISYHEKRRLGSHRLARRHAPDDKQEQSKAKGLLLS
jgi:hypothetical protein